MAEARRDAVRAEGCRNQLLSVASALEQACAHHASAAALTSSPSARPRSRRLKLFPPEYVRILYCTPTGWTPGAKGFAGAACAAASDYHVLVPSEGDRGRWPQHGGDALSEPAVWSGLPALRWGVRGPCRLGRAIQVLVLLVPPCATNRHRWRAPRHARLRARPWERAGGSGRPGVKSG